MATKWHPTEAEAIKEAKDAEMQGYKVVSVRVTLDERDYPRKWWRVVPSREPRTWQMEGAAR